MFIIVLKIRFSHDCALLMINSSFEISHFWKNDSAFDRITAAVLDSNYNHISNLN